MSELLKIVSSQYKHIPGRKGDVIDGRTITEASTLKNEPFSFQALYRAEGGEFCHAVSISAVTELPARAWKVGYVAVEHTAASQSGKEYESREPGLFPDLLSPRPAKPEIIEVKTAWARNFYFEKDVDATLNASDDDFQAVWFTINPDSLELKADKYEIRIVLTSLITNQPLDEARLTLNIIDASLPKQDFYYTNWFHVDCLCDAFDVKPYSNKFYRIFDKFIENMTAHRQNTLLLPAFTPALDTAIGEERMNVQLAEIERTEDGWSFGFEKMRRFVRHAKKCGVEIFEHCHLFSQWGAKNTPNVYDKDGRRIFGFDTDAAGEEYVSFIRAYLKAFLAFAKEEGIEKNVIFHISDEPTEKQIEGYRAAHDAVFDLLGGNPICDAMFDCSFHEAGLVDQPIIHVDHLKTYDENTHPPIWLYYTGGGKNTSNRKISNTAAATRVIGLHMYKYKALGFLHWAYNFYYDRLSFGFCDPRTSVNAYKHFPGITHLCYPASEGCGFVAPSIREKLMGEAMDDLRALRLLESKIGREATLALCEESLGEINAYTVPEGEALRELRELINKKIAE